MRGTAASQVRRFKSSWIQCDRLRSGPSGVVRNYLPGPVMKRYRLIIQESADLPAISLYTKLKTMSNISIERDTIFSKYIFISFKNSFWKTFSFIMLTKKKLIKNFYRICFIKYFDNISNEEAKIFNLKQCFREWSFLIKKLENLKLQNKLWKGLYQRVK